MAAALGSSGSLAAAAASASAQLGAGDTRPGPGMARLGPAMDTLDGVLRDALQELASRNAAALQAIRETADAVVVDAAPSRSLASGAAGAAAVTGSLHAASAAPSVRPAAGGAPAAPASLAASPGRMAAALAPPTPARGVAAARPGSGGGADSPARVVLGPRWGAAEGGRDSLGWVRSLVTYSEGSPLYVADERSPQVALDASGSGFRCARGRDRSRRWLACQAAVSRASGWARHPSLR